MFIRLYRRIKNWFRKKEPSPLVPPENKEDAEITHHILIEKEFENVWVTAPPLIFKRGVRKVELIQQVYLFDIKDLSDLVETYRSK